LNIWSHKGNKLASHAFKEDSLRCVDVFGIGKDRFVVTGGEAQTLTVCRIESGDVVDLTPIALLRGHERSVECVSAKSDGTLLLSGGFDKCLKIWKLESG
jgi:WD40 repeat protein